MMSFMLLLCCAVGPFRICSQHWIVYGATVDRTIQVPV